MTDGPLVVRRYEPADRESVTDICYQTGYMGESAADKFGDRDLFALLFAHAYPKFSPETCFVACLDSAAIGYCFAAVDTTGFKEWFVKRHHSVIVTHAVMRTLWRSPGDIARVLRWDMGPKADLSEIKTKYPAHFHINVLPKYQRNGIGSQLLIEALKALSKRGAGGVHLQTTTRNFSAIKFYQRLGFTLLRTFDHNMWGVAGVQSIAMGKAL